VAGLSTCVGGRKQAESNPGRPRRDSAARHASFREVTNVRIPQLIAGIAIPAALMLPIAALAAPVTVVAQASTATQANTKNAVKAALKSVDLTPHQKLQIKPMIQNYETQSANADPATEQADQKALIKQIYGVLTPAQQTQFKASLKQSMANAQ
jgi:Spy/CpxP family protein refolding chaperone